ncbi:hypothetical protein J7E97_06985 [Streptomyces sp. ISL-66]|uniref:hypothetical protein n=1 Tax=Streptomyces sp. ISL-66 TaxID=2819186 RepID=UPI001BE69955|nr:hypothetical protein [Streptomyces sp. ISL-66]MBT2467617.1 hypothetical protein [Streptomyces sp. ISL-66]
MKKFDVGAAVRRTAGVLGAGALVLIGMAVPAQADAPLPRENDFGFHGHKDIKKQTKAGEKQSLQFGFTNASGRAADGALVVLKQGPGLAYDEKFSNCEYVDGGAGYFAKYTICSFKGNFEAGASYAFDKKLTLTTLPTAFVDFFAASAFPDTPAIREKLHKEAKYTPGSGPELTVTRTDAFSAAAGEHGEDTVSAVGNRADFSVTGATGEGAPGSTVPLEFGWRNDGPATITEPWDFSTVATVEVLLPKGVTMADGCTAHDETSEGGGKGLVWYACGGPSGWQVPANTGGRGKLKVKIDEGVAKGELVGEVKWSTRPLPHHMRLGTFDDTPANNSAKLVLKVTGSGSGGTVTPGPSVTPSGKGEPPATPSSSAAGTPAPPTPSASATVTVTATATPGVVARGGSGGGLARTGTSALAVGGAGAVAVGLGGALWIMARKRRVA